MWKNIERFDDRLKKDEEEAQKLKNIYILYLDKRTDLLKHTQFEVEDVFGDIFLKKTSFKNQQKTKINILSAKML